MMGWFRRWRGLALALALAGTAFVISLSLSAEEQGANEELSEHDQDRVERARQRGEIRPLEEIMPIVRERFTGEVAQIELERDQGTWIYEFKLIDLAGRLIEVRINAKTGSVVRIKGD